MNIEVEIDEQEVIDKLDDKEIFDMSGIEASNCINFFGDLLLGEFTPSEVIEYFGEGVILNEIGEEAVIKHFDIEVVE